MRKPLVRIVGSFVNSRVHFLRVAASFRCTSSVRSFASGAPSSARDNSHNLGFSVLKVDSDGLKTSQFVPMITFLREKVHARDLLALGISHEGTSSNSDSYSSTTPMLLPRGNSIIASFGSIKTVIYHDHILIIG